MIRKVHLNEIECKLGTHIGLKRQEEAERQGLSDSHGLDPDKGVDAQILGACGEIACASALNIYYLPTVNTFKTGDDVGRFQVRTRRDDWHELIIRDDDDDYKPYILVRGRPPDFEVVGWFMAGAAKLHSEWRHAHGGREAAYFVPNEALIDLKELAA